MIDAVAFEEGVKAGMNTLEAGVNYPGVASIVAIFHPLDAAMFKPVMERRVLLCKRGPKARHSQGE